MIRQSRTIRASFPAGSKLFSAAIFVIVMAVAANAQGRSDSRDRHDGTGALIGSYWILPIVESGYFYDSNPLARSNNRKSGQGVYVLADITAESNFGRHGFDVSAGVEHYEYLELSSQSHTNVHGRAQYRIDVRRDLTVLGGVKGGYRHQNQGSLDGPVTAAKPIPFTDFEAWGSVEKLLNRLSISVGGSYRRHSFFDVTGIGGGNAAQRFRNSEVITAGGRLSHLFSPGYRVFADFRYNHRHYRNASFNNSQGYRALAGVEFEITRLLRGEAGVGYMYQNYDSAVLGNRNGFSYALDLIWSPTPLVTVTLGGDRGIQDTTIPGVSGRITTSLKAAIDYEFRRNITVSPSAGIAFNDLSNSPFDNTIYKAGLSLQYFVNRHFGLGADYMFQTMKFKSSMFDRDRHFVGVNAKLRF